MIEAEKKRHKAGIPKEKIAEERIWNKRPDGLAIKMPTTEKVGEFVILEFKRMSCVTEEHVMERSGSPICVHKIGTRANIWSKGEIEDGGWITSTYIITDT